MEINPNQFLGDFYSLSQKIYQSGYRNAIATNLEFLKSLKEGIIKLDYLIKITEAILNNLED